MGGRFYTGEVMNMTSVRPNVDDVKGMDMSDKKTWELLMERGMRVKDIPEQPRTEYIPEVKHIPMEHGFVDAEAISASELEVRIYPYYHYDSFFDKRETYFRYEIHRNGLLIGGNGFKPIDKTLAYGELKSAQAAAQKYIDFVVKFGVNHETP